MRLIDDKIEKTLYLKHLIFVSPFEIYMRFTDDKIEKIYVVSLKSYL